MPAVSKKQAALFFAAAKSPAVAKKTGAVAEGGEEACLGAEGRADREVAGQGKKEEVGA